MRLCVVADLIAHSRGQYELSPVFEGGFQLTLHTKQNMPFVTPMVCKVTRAVLHHAHPNPIRLVAEDPGSPIGHPSFSRMLCPFDLSPVGDTKSERIHLHTSFP